MPELVLSLHRAARVCGVSLSTLRRRKPELQAHGAVVDPSGWRIPASALLALGLIATLDSAATLVPAVAETAAKPSPGATGSSAIPAQLVDEIAELQRQLIEARHRAELAEALAAERLAALDSERLVLRILSGRASRHS